MDKRAVVFCSSIREIDPAYHIAARQVADALCKAGYTVVTGGSWRGTMGAISEEVERCGGSHVGIIPIFMERYAYDRLTEKVLTETMSERKEKMREGCSVAIALPGGIGTLDELVETHVLAKLGQFDGKILVLNLKGFYDPLKTMYQHYVDAGLLSKKDADLVQFVDSVEELAANLV